MNIKEVLSLTAFYLQMEDVLKLPFFKEDGGNTISGDTEAEKTLLQLLRCANLAINEIATDYFPLYTRETVDAVGGTIMIADLKRRLIDVRRITLNGRKVKFKSYPAVIRTVNARVEAEYSYMPDELTLDGETPFGDKVGARVIAYGAAAEYCITSGLFEETVMWEKRFKDALFSAQRKQYEITVKPRVWE